MVVLLRDCDVEVVSLWRLLFILFYFGAPGVYADQLGLSP